MTEEQDSTSQNSHPPTWLRPRVVLFLAVTLLVLKLAKGLLFAGLPTRASDLTLENILRGVNRERQLRNLVPLNTESRLDGAADFKANDMINRNYFSHVDPDGNYIWKKIESLGYTNYSMLGENLAIEFYSADALMDAWMNSPTHRANILQEGFRDQGAGLAFGGANQYHSAVANTFGALFAQPAKKIAAAAPRPAPTPKPAPVKAKVAPVPAPAPALPPAPSLPPTSTVPVFPPVKAREAPSASGTEDLQQPVALKKSDRVLFQSSDPIIAQNPEASELKKSFQLNRILIFIFGLALLFILSKDTKLAVNQNSLEFLDKKINNIVLLLISLIVVALLYWL